MELEPYVEAVHRHFAVAARAGGDEVRDLAERLIAPLDAALRLELQHALADAADEITVELAPGSVELRVRGRDLAFVVTPAPVDGPGDDDAEPATEPTALEAPAGDGEMARINVRMPEHLKARIDQAAAAQHVSVNAWLVRAAGAALERTDPTPRAEQRGKRSPQRYRGWAK